MIINVRGTSGAGKTYLVKSIMALSTDVSEWRDMDNAPEGLFGSPTRRPMGYQIKSPSGRCIVIGNYHGVQCGGCDQLMKEPWCLNRDETYALIGAAAKTAHVLYEGLLISEVHRCAALAKTGFDVRVVHINEPLDVCLSAVNARRAARGRGPVNPKLTVEKHHEIHRQVTRLSVAGVKVYMGSRADSFKLVKGLLGWS